MQTFISVSEARQLIIEQVCASGVQCLLPLNGLTGQVLAEDVYAITDIPFYPQSFMDGYAFRFSDWNYLADLFIEGESAAGSSTSVEIRSKTAMRIFTGAPVPPGADTVVMQEKVRVSDGKLFIEDEKLKCGANVRPKGAEIASGDIAMKPGSLLTPAAIGFLAGIGISQVSVYRRPSITIIVTGNELQAPGKELEYGQVYESNSFSLSSALQKMELTSVNVVHVKDDEKVLTAALSNALERSDIVLLTGGVSVGKYDFVVAASKACGVVPVFHKVKQKPGKPFYFGRKDQKLLFGLPGNPSSVLTCFYIYVKPALEKICCRSFGPPAFRSPLAGGFRKSEGLTHFLKAEYKGEGVLPMDAQESYRMRSFATANCLIELDEDGTSWEIGDLVKVHPL